MTLVKARLKGRGRRPPDAPKPVGRKVESSKNPPRLILVVEDHPLIRMGAIQLIEEAGYEAVEASTADEAIMILEARPDIHLMFTDIEMPGSIDGLKLAHYVRHRWPPVLLIVVSGKITVDERELPAGARFFAKPYNDNKIVETMRDMFAAIDAAV
jgi:two-component system, response regulator PdtaR